MFLDAAGHLRCYHPYLFGLMAVVLMTLARAALSPLLGETSPYITYVIGVAVTAWYGGLWPTLAVTVFSVLTADVFFIGTHWLDAFATGERVTRAVVFLLGAACFALLSEELRRARDVAMRNAERLRVSEAHAQKLLADITAQNERFYAVLQQMPMPVMIGEAPSGDIVFRNQAAIKFWREATVAPGTISADTEAKGFHLDGTDYPSREWPLTRSVSTGEVISGEEMIIVRNDGQHARVRASSTPVRNALGEIIAGVVVLEDLTEMHLAEEALRKAEKLAATGRLAATIAHEVNNPLAAVTNLLYLARTNNACGEPARVYLTQAESELARVSQISRRALGFYRDTEVVQETRGDQALGEVIAVYTPLARNKNIELRCEAEPVIFRTTSGDLRQIALNLISNAMDAVRSNGRIFVRVSAADNGFGTITVEDSGPGIEPATLNRIFDPFFTTKRDVGTGLGLWISREIAEKHGGKISVTSVPGKGTTFTVRLPMSTAFALEAKMPAA